MACRDIDLVLYLQTKQLVDSGASFAARSLVHFFTGCSKEVGRWHGPITVWSVYCVGAPYRWSLPFFLFWWSGLLR